MRCTGKQANTKDHLVAVWTYEKLKKRLFEKHPVTAWILASEDKINGAIHFRYDGLEISHAPNFSHSKFNKERHHCLRLARRFQTRWNWRSRQRACISAKWHKNRQLLFGELEAFPALNPISDAAQK